MRQAFAHDAVVAMAEDADTGAVGAAITVELCGHWEHEPPCPLAPHHTAVERSGELVRVRVLFAAAATDEAEVRDRIARGLERGGLPDPEGDQVRWRLVSHHPSDVRPGEQAHAERLAT